MKQATVTMPILFSMLPIFESLTEKLFTSKNSVSNSDTLYHFICYSNFKRYQTKSSCRSLFAICLYPFVVRQSLFAISLYPFVVRRSLFAICMYPFVVRQSLFAICLYPFVVRRSLFAICLYPFVVCRSLFAICLYFCWLSQLFAISLFF